MAKLLIVTHWNSITKNDTINIRYSIVVKYKNYVIVKIIV